MVGEHCVSAEAEGVNHGGADTRENVDTSNRNAGEIPARRKNQVSDSMSIRVGLAGPKSIPKGGDDGHRVNIPWPVHVAME